jgi:large subunit ribosomal protein L30
MAAKRIRITLKRSLIGVKPKHVRTAHTLGLRRIGKTVEKNMTPDIMGKVRSITHLLQTEEIGK